MGSSEPMWCRLVQRQLTALVDGELSARRAAVVRSHLARCQACARVHGDLEHSVAEQRRVLATVAAPVDVAADMLLGRVRRRVAEPGPSPRRSLWYPTMVGAAALGVLILVVAGGRWDMILVAAGLEAPPKVVADKPELFRDYALFEHLDAVEHFDRVQRVSPGRLRP